MSSDAATPPVGELRARAQTALEHLPDAPLGEIFPELKAATGAGIETSGPVSQRLRNVLRRWKGMSWGPYLNETPTTILRRRGCGLRSLGELLWLAAVGTSDTAKAPLEDVNSATPEGPRLDANSGLMPSELSQAFRTVLAWGYFERGRSRIRDALNLAWSASEVPREVALALGVMDAADDLSWIEDLRESFDVASQLDTVLAALEERDREILSSRVLSLTDQPTLDSVGKRFGLTRERVRQLQTRAESRLSQAMSKPVLRRTAARLAEEIGAARQATALASLPTIAEVGAADLDGFRARLLLWAAGPYDLVGDWVIRRPARTTIAASTHALEALTKSGPVPVAEAQTRLSALGVGSDVALDWMMTLGGFRTYEESIVPWTGSMADKAVAVLELAQVPLHQDELMERIGSGSNLRSLLSQVQIDSRIKRTGLRMYGLRHWEADEYTGIADEIEQELRARGGVASLDHLVSHVSKTYGVSATSVRAYALGPRFSRTASGHIQLLAEPASHRYARPPELSRGVFLLSGLWTLRLRVTDALLGGSGHPVPEGFARAIALEPLSELDLHCGGSRVKFSWPTLSPQMGSIRELLVEHEAKSGDHVLVAPSLDGGAFQVVHAKDIAALSGVARLASSLGLGRRDAEALDEVAKAIGLDDENPSKSRIRARLLARGEPELAELLLEDLGEAPLVLSVGGAKFVEVKWST